MAACFVLLADILCAGWAGPDAALCIRPFMAVGVGLMPVFAYWCVLVAAATSVACYVELCCDVLCLPCHALRLACVLPYCLRSHDQHWAESREAWP
jgi:hypothetical protein